MEKIEAGNNSQSNEERFWIFMWARFPDEVVGHPFSESVLQRMVSGIESAIGASWPSCPEELTEDLLQEKGDLIGLINYMDEIGEKASVAALISDRFAKWIDARADSLPVGKEEFVQKLMNSFMGNAMRF
jgi:hypothetical protein